MANACTIATLEQRPSLQIQMVDHMDDTNPVNYKMNDFKTFPLKISNLYMISV